MPKRTTSSIDVARQAGVSHATVSYVLNKRADKSISEATRQRVLQAAQDLHYRSNRLSHGVLRGKTGLIGVIAPTLVHSYYSGVVQGILEKSTQHDLQPLLVAVQDDIEVEARQIQRFLEYRVDGILCIAFNRLHSRMEHWLEETLDKEIPCVMVDDRSHVDLVDCVVSDDVAGAQSAVAHLLSQGHTRVGHLCGGGITTGADRRTGYEAALRAAGLPVAEELIVGSSYEMETAAAGRAALLALPDPPTAVFAANDDLAEGALQQAQRQGVRVPVELALVGYGDLDAAHGLGLSTVTQHPQEMGRFAAERLWSRMQEPALPPLLTLTPTELIVRRTSGPSRP